MTKSTPTTVDAYLAALAEPARTLLSQVREAIRTAVPGAAESISYGMPAYSLGAGRDGWVIYFAAWKQHYSLYPVSAELLVSLGIAPETQVVKKGTMQLSYRTPVPVTLIKRIAKARAKETRAKLQ